MNLGELTVYLRANTKDLQIGLSRAQKHIRTFTGKMQAALGMHMRDLQRWGRQAAIVGAAVTASVVAIVKPHGAFDQAMRQATAVSEITSKQFEKMGNMALEQSVRLNKAATETTKAFYFLGSAGLAATEQMQAFVPVAVMSKAAVIGMGEAADMLVGTMKGFKIPFTETGRVTDVLTEAVTSANMNFSQLGESLKMVSGIARGAHNTLEQTVAMIATMADVNIRGTRSGMMLRRAILNLQAPTSQIRQILNQYNIELYDAEGRMKPMIRVLGELGEALKGTGEEQRNAAFSALFGARAQAGMLAIFDRGIEAVKEYTKALEESGGATEKVAKKQMKALNEQIGKVGKAFTVLMINIGRTVAPALRNLADGVMDIVTGMRDWVDAHPELTAAITLTTGTLGVMVAAMGTALMVATGLAISVQMLGVQMAIATGGLSLLAGAIAVVIAQGLKWKGELRRLQDEIEQTKEEMDAARESWKDWMETLTKHPIAKGWLNEMEKIEGELARIQKDLAIVAEGGMEEILELQKKYREFLPKSGFVGEYRKLLKEMLELEKGGFEYYLEETQKAVGKFIAYMKDKQHEVPKDQRAAMATWVDITKGGFSDVEKEFHDKFHPRVTEGWSKMTVFMRDQWADAVRSIRDTLADALTDSIMDFKNWRDIVKGLLEDVARILIQKQISEPLAIGLMGAVGRAWPGKAEGVPTAHLGGVVGQLPANRSVPSWVFAKAPKLHSGLMPDEVPAILQRGETVLPKGAAPAVTNEIHLHNETGRPMKATEQRTRFDGRKYVTEIIMRDAQENGPIVRMMRDIR